MQVLLFLQKEKEESSPEAQVKEENRENLKHCGHCQVLNGSNYTDPPVLFLLPVSPSPLYPSHLTAPVTLYLPSSRSLSFSVLPSYWRVKGTLRSYWGHNRLLIPLSTKNKCTCITTGGLRKSKKAITMKTLAWIWKKKILFETVVVSRFHKDGVLFQQSAVDQGEPFRWFDWKKSAP